MRKVFYLSVFVILLNVGMCNAENQGTAVKPEVPGYVITIKSENMDDAYLYLSRRVQGNWENIDSSLFNSGRDVIFKGSIPYPEVLYLRLENMDKTVMFFAENSEITIIPDFENPEKSFIDGSAIHKEYLLYESLFTELNRQQEEVYKEYQLARKEGDEAKIAKIVSRFDEFAEVEMNMNKKYIREHAGSFVSPYIIRSKMYYTMSLDELKAAVSALEPVLDHSVYTIQLKEHIAVLEKVAIGMKYTDFSLSTPEGGHMSLSEVAGKGYLLVDFWASWCGPCRRENPNVVRIYNEFHAKGFDIFGVSFDTSKENWLKAIEDDKLTWNHVSDLQGWGNAAGRLYGVNSIPHTVLLDPQGKIIAKNLKSDELEKMLNDLLN